MEVLKPFRIQVLKDILGSYQYDRPFSAHFLELSKQHRNWGSKDRKIYRSLAYAYFRLGHATNDLSTEEAILKAWSCLQDKSNFPAPDQVFPFPQIVSAKAGFETWAASLLIQSPVYLRIRKGRESEATALMKKLELSFEFIGTNSVRLPAESKCNELIEKGLAWVMDISSQTAADCIDIPAGETVWDACSGAGGKSLFIADKFNSAFSLTCSDKRFSILENLKTRFGLYQLPQPHVELSDLTDGFQLSDKFDKIILDVPCTGSGTWGRSPEQIKSFNPEKVLLYSTLQNKIFDNVVRHLNPDGKLYYITCSVFPAENEDNIKMFCKRHSLKILREKYFFNENSESDFLFLAEIELNN